MANRPVYSDVFERSIKKLVAKIKATYSKLSETVSKLSFKQTITDITDEEGNVTDTKTINYLVVNRADGTTEEIEMPIGGGSGNAILGDDEPPSEKRVYSSLKVNTDFAKKTDLTPYAKTESIHVFANQDLLDKIEEINVHSHTNKEVLDGLTAEKITQWNNASNPINDASLTGETDHTYSSAKILELDKVLDDKKVDKVQGMGLSSNDFTTRSKRRVEMLSFEGNGDRALFDDGYYYKITNCGIEDTIPSDNYTYSSTQIEKRIADSVSNLVLPTQNDAPTLWQKGFLNVSSGDTLELTTTQEYIIDKVLVQVFKYVEGETGVTKTFNKFTVDEEDSYFYNHDHVMFSNLNGGQLKLKDTYTQNTALNSDGFYESEVIKKSDFVELNSITVEERVKVD